MENQKQTEQIDVYALVTNRIIELLEAGTVPWRQPWTSKGVPRNLLTKRPYQGVNVLLLNALPFEHNLFLTWKQIKTIGASVNKGEKGHIVVFTKMIEVPEGTEMKKKFFLRYYKVFNVAQTSGINAALLPPEDYVFDKITTCDLIVEGMPNPPMIMPGGEQASYTPGTDIVAMPPIKSFNGAEPYYSVLFHELIHSTGHESRLKRKEVVEKIVFGSESYSLEELVAEIGACYLKSYSGIMEKGFDNSVAYIQHWLEVFKNDKRMIVYASSKAQKAVDYILNLPVEVPVEKNNHENTIALEEELVG
jgi:antirestriction protein ArdC